MNLQYSTVHTTGFDYCSPVNDCQYTVPAIIYMVAHGHLFIIWILFLFRKSFQLSDYNSLQYRICILSEAVSVWADTGTLKAVMSHGCVCFFPLTGDFCLPPTYLLTWVCAQFKAWEQCRDVTLQPYYPAKAGQSTTNISCNLSIMLCQLMQNLLCPHCDTSYNWECLLLLLLCCQMYHVCTPFLKLLCVICCLRNNLMQW